MIKKFPTALLLTLVALLGFTVFLLRSTPKIFVAPEEALVDQPVIITVHNLKPHAVVTLEASCKNKDGDAWISSATFQADENGIVNVAEQAPLAGSYSGIDPMGLFWSMALPDKEVLKKMPSTFNFNEVLLSVLIDNKVQTTKTIQRLPVAPNVVRKEIREDGIIGTLLYPQGAQHNPGIIVVGGSGGRIPEDLAKLFASHGYTTLALGFFGVPGLPKNLENIPLEYFQHAMQWFKQQPEVNKDHVALCGRSRGGELVLLLGAIFPQEMQAIIAYVPSGIVFPGMPDHSQPTWTYNSSPVPYLAGPSKEELATATKQGLLIDHKGTFDDPHEGTSDFLYILQTAKPTIEAATIPVENIQCPVLLISAEDDKMWPSTLLSNMVMERLDQKQSTIVRKHLKFPGAGHGVQNPYGPSAPGGIYYHPKAQSWHTVGGTVEGNARANEQAWQGVLDFLHRTLSE